MNEIELKSKLDKMRLQTLHHDLEFLQSNGYVIVSVSEERFRICVQGCLFDFKSLNALYVFASLEVINGSQKCVLYLEY